jgi:hypothetical protein
MVSLVYLLRSPVSTISRSLYDPDDHHHTTLAVEHGATAPTVSHPGEVVCSGDMSYLTIGARLTLAELLMSLLNARKVVTL